MCMCRFLFCESRLFARRKLRRTLHPCAPGMSLSPVASSASAAAFLRIEGIMCMEMQIEVEKSIKQCGLHMIPFQH